MSKQSISQQKAPLTREQVEVMNRLKKLRVECASLAVDVIEAMKFAGVQGNDYGRGDYTANVEQMFSSMAADIGRAYAVPRA